MPRLLALRPVLVGAKRTVTEQLELTASELPQVVLKMLKWAELNEIPLKFSGWAPVLVIVVVRSL